MIRNQNSIESFRREDARFRHSGRSRNNGVSQESLSAVTSESVARGARHGSRWLGSGAGTLEVHPPAGPVRAQARPSRDAGDPRVRKVQLVPMRHFSALASRTRFPVCFRTPDCARSGIDEGSGSDDRGAIDVSCWFRTCRLHRSLRGTHRRCRAASHSRRPTSPLMSNRRPKRETRAPRSPGSARGR